jgi:RNA polymerase sigma-70 factor (ECF subfamily)
MREDVFLRIRPESDAPVYEPAESDEAQLIDAAKASSSEAWAKIYAGNYRPVYRYIRARIFDDETAEDLAASVFVEAMTSIRSYSYRGRPLLAWLYRLARNIVADHRARLARERANGEKRVAGIPRAIVRGLASRLRRDDGDIDSVNVALVAQSQTDPSTVAERLDLRDAIKSLTRDQREVIILRYHVGLSTHEIARVMGRAPSAVYSLAARALITLKRRLGDETAAEERRIPTRQTDSQGADRTGGWE